MKKILSVLLATMMVFAVSASTMVAMAATVNSYESTTKASTISGMVNGQTSSDITYEVDPENPNKITFTYNGEGDISGWEFPGMTEGVDYDVLDEDGNTITIELINGYDGDVTANVIVDENGESTTSAKTTKKSTTGKSTSPNTGAVTAAGVAVAGVGVAILAAVKKNDAE
jgi:cytochrome c oxidase assembly protein Cox11